MAEIVLKNLTKDYRSNEAYKTLRTNIELMYQLNPIKFKGKIEEVESIWTVMWSKTLRWFYLISLVIVIVVYIFESWPILFKIIPICTCR